MLIKNISAKNFRNYNNLNFELNIKSPVNIIVSPNGMGKTNLLEMIYYFSYLRSFRNVIDKELITKGEDYFFIECDFINNSVTNNIKISYKNKKEIKHNNKKVDKFSNVLGKLAVVLFSSEDIFIIKGSPSVSRKFFDIFISVIDKEYLHSLRQYQEILKQKNYLLKQNKNNELFDVFNIQLSELIKYIQKIRSIFIEKINKMFQELYNSLGLYNNSVKIVYSPSIKLKEDNIKKVLDNNIQEDLIFGHSLLGSHRDKYYFFMNGIPFSKYASFGQTRLASLVLKLVQAEYYKDTLDTFPVLLLDDVILELDKGKQKRFLEKISNYKQLFITVTNDEYVKLFNNNARINTIGVNNGQIRYF